MVGYGLGGRCFHAPFLHSLPQYDLCCVLERNKQQSAIDYPGITVVRHMDELLNDKSIQLLVITSPNESHFAYARQALLANRMVVLDKPMTVTASEAGELIQLARERSLLLSVYQSRRFASDALTLKKLLGEKKLGEVHEFEAHYNRYRPLARDSWKEKPVPGSGLLFDLGPHLIDQALDLFGQPQTICADIRRQRPHAQTDDYFDIRMMIGNTRVILKAGMLVREPGPRYQVHGTLGSFIKYGDDPQDAALRAGGRPGSPGWGVEPETSWGLLHTEWEGREWKGPYPSEAGDFGAYYRLLYNAIVSGAPLPVRAEDGYNVVRLIELARESSLRQCTLPCSGLLA